MLDAIVGAVIMVVASTSLLLAIEVTEDALSASGRYPLNDDELILLDNLVQSLTQQQNPLTKDNRATTRALMEIDGIEQEIINKLPTQYQ